MLSQIKLLGRGSSKIPYHSETFFNEFEVLSHVEKVVTTYVPDAELAEHNWSLHIRHHMKSINRFKAKNVEKVSMV